jgi:hypothetical protein
MPDIRLRPRFRRPVRCSPRAVLGAIGRAVGGPGAPVAGTVFESSAVLKVLPDRQHFWSPQLQLSVEADGDGAEVHGLFGPHPTVWSLFIAAYVAIGFLGSMGVTFGFAQWTMGRVPWALWSAPLAAALALAVWIVGRAGRRLGMEQVRELFAFVEATLDACGETREPRGSDDDAQFGARTADPDDDAQFGARTANPDGARSSNRPGSPA